MLKVETLSQFMIQLLTNSRRLLTVLDADFDVFVVFSYAAYLDSQITKKDMYYLEDIELARQLVELG